MENEIAKPLKTVSIRNIAQFTRRMITPSDDAYVDVLKALEILTFKFAKYDFNFFVLPDDDLIFELGEEAKTDITQGTIYIKETVYKEAARKKYCRAHFTIAHEIGHFVLHRILNTMVLARTGAISCSHKIYENPEWQANTFASEFLMPYQQCLKLSVKNIKKKYHVTLSAANTRYVKVWREFNVKASEDMPVKATKQKSLICVKNRFGSSGGGGL